MCKVDKCNLRLTKSIILVELKALVMLLALYPRTGMFKVTALTVFATYVIISNVQYFLPSGINWFISLSQSSRECLGTP